MEHVVSRPGRSWGGARAGRLAGREPGDSTPALPRRAGFSNEMLLGALLVLVIVAGIVMAVIGWRSSPNDPAEERANRRMAFQCERCGHKFSMAPADFHKQWKDVDLSRFPKEEREKVRYKAHCPKCGRRFCSKMLNDSREGGTRTLPPGGARPGE